VCLEEIMNEGHREISYRAALDEANRDLDQILERLAYLRSRKEQVDGVVLALRPVVDALKPVIEQPQANLYRVPEPAVVSFAPAQPVAEPVFQSFERTVESKPIEIHSAVAKSADKIQAHIDQVIGMWATA
jgi:hypothetical protein